MTLLIDDEDVKKAVTPEDVIDAVEDAYRQHGLGKAQDMPRREVRMKGLNLPHLATGTTSVGQGLSYLGEQNIVVISHTFHFHEKEQRSPEFPGLRLNPGLIHILDGNGGRNLAIIRSSYASWMRTSAAGAVGVRHFARKESKTVGIIGTGLHGKGQLYFLSKAMKIDKVLSHTGRRKDPEYADLMSKRLGINVTTADSVESLVKNSDVITVVTRSQEPIVHGDWIKKGTHINTVGADDPHKVELDPATLKRADKVVVDSERSLEWIGHIAKALKEGAVKPEKIWFIGQVCAGLKPGRENPNEITVFSSEGTNMQTAGVAWKVYQKVKAAGLGKETETLPKDFTF